MCADTFKLLTLTVTSLHWSKNIFKILWLKAKDTLRDGRMEKTNPKKQRNRIHWQINRQTDPYMLTAHFDLVKWFSIVNSYFFVVLLTEIDCLETGVSRNRIQRRITINQRVSTNQKQSASVFWVKVIWESLEHLWCFTVLSLKHTNKWNFLKI